ncbi:hypothetical protein Drorol1_Dr00015476 [Drosera rotundifolia]
MTSVGLDHFPTCNLQFFTSTAQPSLLSCLSVSQNHNKKQMLCKFPSVEAFSSIKTTANATSSSAPHKTSDSNHILANPNANPKRISTIQTPLHPKKPPLVEQKQRSSPHLGTNPDKSRAHFRSIWVRSKRVVDGAVKGGKREQIVEKEKVHARYSTICLSYGGNIPAMLAALDDVRDLDEALGPWKEKIGKKERSIILKEQASWKRAVEIFEWFKRKGCYELNVIHYNIMIRILGRAQRWGELERLLDEMRAKKIDPVSVTFGTLIDVYSKGGKREEAVAWLQRMNEAGIELGEVTMATVVQFYKKAREFKKGEEFFKKWSSDMYMKGEAKSRREITNSTSDSPEAQLPLSSYTYNTLIDTYGKAGQLQEASETYNRMLESGVIPDVITFSTMMHLYGNHDRLEEVNAIMRKMEELDCLPDSRTYNILISIYSKHNDIDRAVDYFMRMKEACLEADLVSYRTLLNAFSIRLMVSEAEKLLVEMDKKGLRIDEYTQTALARMYIKAGMLEKSWLWFLQFHAEGNMSSECYSAYIDAYGEQGHVLEAETVFISCKKMKKLGVLEYNVMLKAYGIGKSCNKACKLFESMESEGVIADRLSYDSLILMLAAAHLPQIAKRYILKMQEAGITTNCIPYCAVISSFAKLGCLEDAKGVYEAMIGHGVEADVIVYGVLINAFAVNGDAKEALAYIAAMRNAGMPLNPVICSILIKFYTKFGYLQEAEETYKLLVTLKGGPDPLILNYMIGLYSERLMAQEAETLFHDMQTRGHTNEFSYAMMLCMYRKMGRLEEAMRIGLEMQELGLITKLLSYNSMMNLFVLTGEFKKAAAMLQEMNEVGVLPDDFTFRSLGGILIQFGISKQVVSELEVRWKRDPQNGTKAWISALTSVVEG